MHIWQPRVALPSAKLMMAALEEGPGSSSHIRSDVWKPFEKSGPKSAICRLCNKEYAYLGRTSNLREHLTRSHPGELNNPQKQNPSLDRFLARSRCPNSRAKQITGLIGNMVAQGLRPAATVEGEGFHSLMRYVEPGYKVPSAVHIAKVVHQKHDIGKRALNERLQMEGQSIAITSDIWTSCANDAYISLTAHFITTDRQMVSCVLATIVAHFQGIIQVSILLIS